MEPIELRDIVLLAAGWAISKALDFLFHKAKETVTPAKKKKPHQRKQQRQRKRK